MSKWKSKFSSMMDSLKNSVKRTSSKSNQDEGDIDSESQNENKFFRKSSPSNPGDLVESMDWEEGDTGEVHLPPSHHSNEEESYNEENYSEESYNEESYEDEEDPFHEETSPSFETLTIDQIKQSQVDNGEAPPEVPNEIEEGHSLEDDHNYQEEENDFDLTNPSIREYAPKQKRSLFSKLSQLREKKAKPLNAGSSTESSPFMEKIKNINLDEFFEKFYSPQNRNKIHYTFLLLLLIGVSIKSAQIISTVLTPLPATTKKAAPPPRLNELDQIKNALAQLEQNDLFRAPRKGKEPVKVTPKTKEQAICLEAKKKSSLQIKLLSTLVLQDEVKSLASVQRRKDSEYLRKGDSIPGVLEVGRIDSEKLIFKNLKTRECEYIENAPKKDRSSNKMAIVREPRKAKKLIQDTKKNGISNTGNQFKIKKEVRARMLENISEVLTQARAVQIKNPDGSLSFRMQEVVPGSIYSQLNIENGDVVTGINGEKIQNVSELMQLFGKIDQIDHFELTVKKKGIEQNLKYDFE